VNINILRASINSSARETSYNHFNCCAFLVGLERGSLRLVSKIEELLGRNSRGSGLENREYGRGGQLLLPRDTLYPAKVGTNFVDMRRSLGRYRSFADKDHGVCNDCTTSTGHIRVIYIAVIYSKL
jgi:hypothetical protein